MPKSAAKKSVAKKAVPNAKPLGAAEAVEAFRPAARALAAADVRLMRADPTLARHNVTVGLAAVLPHKAVLAALPAPFDMEQLESLDALSLAVVHAAAQVDTSSPGTTKKLISRAAELRDLLLSAALPLAKSKLVPEALVKKIKAGTGSRDAAQDCVDLAKLFRDHAAAVKGKSPITKDQVDEAAAIGTELLGILKPARAKRTVRPEVKDAADLRNRLWTLLQSRHTHQLRRAGAWLWVDDVDAHVPPLQSAKGKRRAAKATESAET